jgi:hypothetical protein
LDIEAFLQAQTQPIALINTNKEETMPLPSATAGEVMTDTTPSPQDWIAPRILTPGGLLVLGGAPKWEKQT